MKLPAKGAEFARALLAAFAPPERIPVSEWAEKHRIIPRGNAEPGAWSNARVPYVVEPADCVNDDAIHTIIVAGCSQSSKTAGCGENIVGWAITHDPATIIWATPSDASALTAASRFDAMIAATPELKKRFGSRTARSVVNNSGLKEFEGGKLVIVSAGSPSSLASHPARLVIADEIDRFPHNLRREGDPIGLLRARQTTFARRKFIGLSSPTEVGHSRIEALFETGDRREWHWRCDCGEEHIPEWENVNWEPGKPEGAHYSMPCCGTVLGDADRLRLMSRGRWRAMAAGQPGVRSFRFRGLSSPWLSLSLLASEFDAARGSPSKLAPFFNTRLGLPFEAGVGEGADADVVRSLAENWSAGSIPERKIVLITAGIDVQQTWLAVHIVGWSDGDEAWSLAWHEIPGDPLDPRTWAALEDVLTAPWRHPSGDMLNIEAAAIDSGFQSQAVYEFSGKHRVRGRRWYAVKGMAGAGRPIWQRGADVHASMSKLHLIGLDLAKAQVASGIVSADDGPGRWHTPTFIHELAPHFADWLCSEELVTKDTTSGPKSEWRKRKGVSRNEVWDCSVYALAARYSSDFRIPQRIERLSAYGALTQKTPDFAALAKRLAATTT